MARSDGSRMKKPCDCCQRYLNHLDEKKQNMKCFLRRMTGNFKHTTIVPNRFLKQFAGELSRIIKLESPNGSLYEVQVTERYSKMVLKHGWEAFVDAHHIEEDDSVLFRHIEKCCFEALIFDSNGYEKVFPCAGIKDTPSVRERSVDSVDISSSSQHDTTESSGRERFARCEKGSSSRCGKIARMSATSSSSDEPGEDIPSESESFELDDHRTPPGTDYVISSRSYLSNAQKERVITFIQEIEPEVTVFVAVMHKSHVRLPSPFLAITKEYAFAYFPRETTNVTLQRQGSSKKWHPKFCKRKGRNVYILRGEWSHFVRDNHLQEGDICLLLPTKGARKFTFTVHLLRITSTHSRGGTGFQRVGPYPGRSNAEMTSAVHIKEEPTDGEHVSSENGTREISNESLEGEDFGGPIQPPYIVPWKNHLSRSQKKVVEKKVQGIHSELPINVAIMSKSSVGVSRPAILELGSRFTTAIHLTARGQIVVLKYMRKIWETKMVVHGRRQFLSGGWSKFVRDNDLRVGDICMFEVKKDKRKLTMEVHIIFREQF